MSQNSVLDVECWQDMGRHEKITKMLNDEILTDCKFLVGPEESTAETISGHKVMFVLESPVLEKMLVGTFVEAENNYKIRINDVLPQDFKNFRYMVYHNDYSKYSSFSFEEIFELHRIADKYLVSSICGDCMQFLKSSITRTLGFDRIIVLFEFASELEDKSLLTAVEKEISQREVGSILNEKINEYSSKLFYNYLIFVTKLPNPPTPILIFNAIKRYFDRNHIIKNKVVPKIMELDIFPVKDVKDNKQSCSTEKKVVDPTKDLENFTEKYVKEKEEEFNDISVFKRNLFKLVNFEKMTLKEFIGGPGKSDLLGIQQKYDWLTYLCINKKIL